MEDITPHDLEVMKKKIGFFEAVLRKYVLTGHGQLDDAYKDWQKGEGMFRN